MKSNFYPTLLLISALLCSCSTSPEKKVSSQDKATKSKLNSKVSSGQNRKAVESSDDVETDSDSVDWDLEEAMFNLPDKIAYTEYKDLYQVPDKSKANVNSLARESLSKTSRDDLKLLSDSEDPIDRGSALCELNKADEGLKWLDDHYAAFKAHPPFWNAIGICYLKMKAPRKALLYFNKALEINEQYAPAWNNLGVLYLQDDQDQEALVAFEKAEGFNKFSQTPTYNLAFLYLEYGLVEKAEKYFINLLQTAPNDQELKVGIAISQLFQKKIDASLKSFSEIDSDAWERPDVGINYAVALFLGNSKEKAKKVFSKVDISKNNNFKDYYKRAGKLVGDTDA